MDATDDTKTDQQPLVEVLDKVDTPSTLNVTAGPLTDPASGISHANTVWQRKRTVHQVRNQRPACANVNIRRNLNVVPGGETTFASISDILFPESSRFFLVKKRYEYWAVDKLSIQIQATANWLTAGGVLVLSYTHDPLRNKHNISRQCDMYMTRITDTQKVNIPVRLDWFYSNDHGLSTPDTNDSARFCSPGSLQFQVRGLGGKEESYQATVTIHANVKFASPTIILPPAHTDLTDLVLDNLKLDPTFTPITQPAKPVAGDTTLIQFKIIGYVGPSDTTDNQRFCKSPTTFSQGIRLRYNLNHASLATIHRHAEFFSIVYTLEPGSDANLLTISIKPPQGYAVSLPLDPKTDLIDFQIGTRAVVQRTAAASNLDK